jgi:diaminohydroxyphosphoribosylaminopyrimidine deaminase/5-amino-6-(5-phosphoribosylamino)uracil reductase
VVVDSQLRTPPRARILADDSSTLIVCAHADPARRDALLEAGALILALPDAHGRVDLAALMKELAARGLNEIHAEAGATLNAALLAADLVDEWLAYFACKILGHHARGLFDLPALDDMAKSRQFQLLNIHMLGQDLRLTLRPA